MSLELLNTIASLITVTIVAATAISALVQLRHLRAGNQINALISVGEKLDSRAFTDSLTLVNGGLDAALADPAFREHEISIFRREPPPPNVDQGHIDMHHAVILVGNTFEEMGVLVRNRIVDPGLFIDQYCSVALGAWKRLANYTALGREAKGFDPSWEMFEYLAVLSEDWIASHPSSYPKGVRRIALHNPWPMPAPAPDP